MIKDTPDGQTHSFNDGCGEPAHNSTPHRKETRKVKLSNGKYAIVDVSDYASVSKLSWHFRMGYATRWNGDSMHRILMKPEGRLEVDHINGDRLDNRRSNLRVCTRSQNMRNRKTATRTKSGFKGVAWHKGNKKWIAHLKTGGKTIHLGYFTDKKKAALAYNNGAIIHHKEFANLNVV